jgi:protein JSN1
MAAVITLHSVRLATNANGALLLTWLLDTCNFPNRFKTLAPRLVSHLVKLCTHKLASLTVLKLINQRSEPEARELVLNTLFNGDDENKVLKRILEDQVHGAAVIYKILTSPFVADQGSAERRTQIISVVRNMLQKLKVQPSQGYKRLMDEVGLADRTIATPPINSRVPQRSTTPREYTAPNSFAPGTFYSPQHSYAATPQYTSVQQQQLEAILGMDMGTSPPHLYASQQIPQTHAHQDSAQAAAYQYQQMLMIQQRSYNGYTPPQQPQQVYQQSPGTQQAQFGGPLIPPQNIPQGMGVYGVNGNPGYPYSPGDVYNGNRQRQR